MILWLIGGLALLVGGLFAARTFVSVNPKRLASIVTWSGVALLVALGVLLLVRERIPLALMAFGAAAVLAGWRSIGRMAAGQAAPGGQSTVETPWLRMNLDHETGETGGVVLQGRFAGAALSELSVEELGALLSELRIEHPDSAKLLEAYLTRVHGDAWREEAGPVAPRASGAMSVEDALDILGLEPGATANDIREAHRKLMQRVHPDKGGSDYFAAKLNEARDLLLGKG